MRRFGEKLRALREHRGLSYRQLAAELGVSHGHLSGLEAGAHMPSPEFILAIAAYFEVTTDQLMRNDLEVRLK
jgi:repressor LexA